MTRSAPVVVFRDTDADPAALAGQSVAVIGYGNLGRSIALNLRDSGLTVVVGNQDDAYRDQVADDGYDVLDIPDAVARADVVLVLLPDEVIPDRFRDDIAPRLRPGAALVFASGYALAFGLVEPPDGVDVLLLAPRMLGEQVRECFLSGVGFVSYVGVEHDASGTAKSRLLALARACGALRRGALQLTARQEATLDLFVEQSLGPYLGTAIQLCFALGVEAGLPPEAMVLELYMSGEMSRTLQAFADEGFYRSVTGHGLVATYGGYLGTLDLDVDGMQARFREVLGFVSSGGFARKLQEEQAAGYPTVEAIRAITAGDDPQSAAERRVRELFGAG